MQGNIRRPAFRKEQKGRITEDNAIYAKVLQILKEFRESPNVGFPGKGIDRDIQFPAQAVSEIACLCQFLGTQIPGIAPEIIILPSHVNRIGAVEESNAAFLKASCGGKEFRLNPLMFRAQS
jgi:hypothetical protein